MEHVPTRKDARHPEMMGVETVFRAIPGRPLGPPRIAGDPSATGEACAVHMPCVNDAVTSFVPPDTGMYCPADEIVPGLDRLQDERLP